MFLRIYVGIYGMYTYRLRYVPGMRGKRNRGQIGTESDSITTFGTAIKGSPFVFCLFLYL